MWTPLQPVKLPEESAAEINRNVSRAITFATERHAGQVRKGTVLPYIVHPLEVLCILSGMTTRSDILVAGVLHDTLEDTATTPEEIREIFGEAVLELVTFNSEDKSKSWQERKAHTIEELRLTRADKQMVVMADKVANLRSMRNDYHRVGEELWKRFNAPVEKQAWYFEGICDALSGLQYDSDTAPVYAELVNLCHELFMTYYTCGESLYRVSRSGAAFLFRRGADRWEPFDGGLPQGAAQVSKLQADATLCQWQQMQA